jgi:hypothetical protein
MYLLISVGILMTLGQPVSNALTLENPVQKKLPETPVQRN